MSAPRISVLRGTLGVTRRTIERKLLWTPAAGVAEGYKWALAKAQEEQGFALHHGVLMPTHEHLTITPGPETNVGEAFRILHRESARFLQESLLARGYDAPQCIWDKRQTHAMHLVDAGAQIEWMLYCHLNAPQAGLVATADDWPGWLTPLSHLRGGVEVLDRPDLYVSDGGPSQRQIVSSPSPDLVRLFGSDLEGLVYWMEKQREAHERALEKERKAQGRRVLGAGRVKKIHPFSEPATCRERRGQRVPRFKIGRGWEGRARKELVEQLAGEVARFRAEHAERREQWIAGDRSAEMPYGTLQLVSAYGAEMAAPHADAVLCAPDRTLSERPEGTLRALVATASEVALEELAEELADLQPETLVVAGEPVPVVKDDDVVEVEHRELESPARSADRPHAKRLVILRERRHHRREPGDREPES